MGAGSDKPSSDQQLTRALALVTDILRSKGRETGSNIGQAIRRELPGFDPHALGFASLSQLLVEAADDLVVVDRKGEDRVWALGEFVSDRDIEHALGPEPETETEDEDEDEDEVGFDPGAVPTRAVPTRIDLVNFRSCRDVRLELAPAGLTVLVGPNGSGKSTVLYGSSYVSQVTRGKLRALFSGTRDIRRLRSNGMTGPLELAISAGDNIELRLKAEPADDDTTFTVSLKTGKAMESWTSPGPRPKPPLPPRPLAALRAMLRHDWLLNIRDCEKVLTTAVALVTDGVLEAAHLPELLRRGSRAEPPDAAWPRTQVARWLRRFGIQASAFCRAHR